MKITMSMKAHDDNVAEAANKLIFVPYTGTHGLYSAVDVVPEYVDAILKLADELELSPDEHALHCTVVYSKVAATAPLPEVLDVVQAYKDNQFSALVNAVESWVGHNGKTYIVLKLVSESVISLNARCQQLGAEHTFIPYSPHITLSDEVPVDDAMKARIEFVNKRLARNPVQIMLKNFSVGDQDD